MSHHLGGVAVAHRLACHVYVSEGRRWHAIERLLRAAKSLTQPPGLILASTFPDVDYNRTCFTFVATAPTFTEHLADAVAGVATVAADIVDMREQHAAHPRLGVLDHVSVHPLAEEATMDAAANAARAVAERLGNGSPHLPYYLYGAASASGDVRLSAIRRSLGYFAGETSGNWQGTGAGGTAKNAIPDTLAPDGGPATVHDAHGIVCVGATPWVTHVNVPLVVSDASVNDDDLLPRARSIARAIAERHGGLPGVEAMALPKRTPPFPPNLGDADLESLRSSVEQALAAHSSDGAVQVVEVACNVRTPDVTSPEKVVETVLARARACGLKAHNVGAYTTQATKEELLSM
ncbi:glutamate formimidoyltransferase [Pycnococcus provasolii]